MKLKKTRDTRDLITYSGAIEPYRFVLRREQTINPATNRRRWSWSVRVVPLKGQVSAHSDALATLAEARAWAVRHWLHCRLNALWGRVKGGVLLCDFRDF